MPQEDIGIAIRQGMGMTETYQVRLEKESFVFSAAHFITFGPAEDEICEPLHGHNYRVSVDVAGPLGPQGYVVDFIALQTTLRGILSVWDHHVLLPTRHPRIQVSTSATEVVAIYLDRRWVFPLEDCVLLPIENTTAELLARLVVEALWNQVQAFGGEQLTRIEARVDENHGQWGAFANSRHP